MKLAKVIGNLVSTIKNEAYTGKKILWVQPIDLEGKDLGDAFITIDAIGAGAGETVLVLEEGGGAQMVCERTNAPIGTAIVAIVDEIRIAENG
jgi:ethanolamine utilization protein EutN